MWSAYLKMETCHRRPSEDLDDPSAPLDDIAKWCVDGCVLWFGLTAKNALAETKEVGVGKDKRREQKYTLSQLLDAGFRLPRPLPAPKAAPAQGGFAMLLALAKQGPSSGVKLYQYVGPEAKPI